ncbi:hypothetical protein NPIL_155651, partial [Nephila pilipes]
MNCTNRETSFLSAKLFSKQIIQSPYQDELLSKIDTKYGRNNCHLDIPDKPKREAVVTFRLFTGHDCLAAHLYRISILTEAACPLVTKEMSLWTNTVCVIVVFSTETRNYRDIG